MTVLTIDRVQTSSCRLSSSEVDADSEVERLRSLIGGTGASFTVLRVGRRDLRRFDVWLRGDDVGVVPYRDDPDAVVSCGVGSGVPGILLLLELVADVPDVPDVPVSVAGGGVRPFAEIGMLVQQVTSDATAPERAVIVHSHAQDADLVRVSGPGTWWGCARSGDPLDLHPAGDAAYWAAVFEMLNLAP